MQPRDAKLVAFDNDGTIYPAGLEVGAAVLAAHGEYVKRHGLNLKTPGIELVHALIGSDADKFYSAMMPGQPKSVVADFEEFCLDQETAAVRQYPGLYPGAHELLSDLKAAGKTLVLVSNGGPRYVQNVWDAAGYERYFSASYPYSGPEYLTKGERLALSVEEWGGSPAVMVGDRASDLEAAQFAGTMFVGCAFGYGTAGELDGASTVVSDFQQLREVLL